MFCCCPESTKRDGPDMEPLPVFSSEFEDPLVQVEECASQHEEERDQNPSNPSSQRSHQNSPRTVGSEYRFVLKFKILSGQFLDLDCTEKQFPLGIKFYSKVPVEVGRVEPGSVAEEL